MKLVEFDNWSCQELEFISFSLEEGETLLLLGSQSKKSIFSSILGLNRGKQGQIIWYPENSLVSQDCAVVFGDMFYPLNLKPVEIAGIFSGLQENFSENQYKIYLERLNLSLNVPLTGKENAYKCALVMALCGKPKLLLLEIPDFSEEEPLWKKVFSEVSRILQREECGKIILAPCYEGFELWKIDYFGYIQGKNLLFLENHQICEKNLGKISCSLEESYEIAAFDYILKKRENDGFFLLLRDIDSFSVKYNTFTPSPCGIGEFFHILLEHDYDEQ